MSTIIFTTSCRQISRNSCDIFGTFRQLFIPDGMMQMNGHSAPDRLCIPILQKIHNQDVILIGILRNDLIIEVKGKGFFNGFGQQRHKPAEKIIMGCPDDGTVEHIFRFHAFFAGRI